MVKRYLKKIIDVSAYVVAMLFNPKIINLFKYFLIRVYSYYVKKGLFKAGIDFSIEFPAVIKGGQYITIGNGFSSFARLRLEAYSKHLNYQYNPQIIIGNNVSINYDCHIGCVNKVVIGDNVLIASKVFITDHFHGEITKEALELPPSLRKVSSKGPVIIEENVWIGEGVAIMPNVIIGKNSILGANSVVTKNVEPNSIIAGNPAKLIRKLA